MAGSLRTSRYVHQSKQRVMGNAVHIDRDLTAAPATSMVLMILSEEKSYGYAISDA